MKRLILCFCFLYNCCVAQTRQHIKVTPLGNGFYVYESYGVFKGSVVGGNGLLLSTPKGVAMVDTPWDDDQTNQLIDWVAKNLDQKILFCISTHYHDDRIGGIGALKANGIKTFASEATSIRALAQGYPKVSQTFKYDTILHMGSIPLEIYYPGAGHAPDNEAVWFPRQKLLFGGCIVKSTDTNSLGNIAEADLKQWPLSIKKLIKRYPEVVTIIPGHGDWTDNSSLQHTLKLLDDHKTGHE